MFLGGGVCGGASSGINGRRGGGVDNIQEPEYEKGK